MWGLWGMVLSEVDGEYSIHTNVVVNWGQLFISFPFVPVGNIIVYMGFVCM